MAKTGLPAISSNIPPDLRQFLNRVQDFIVASNKAGDIADQMQAAGLLTKDRFGNFSLSIPTGNDVDLTPPPALTGLAAVGGITFITLTWDDPQYTNLGFIDIYRSATDVVGDAICVGSVFSGVTFIDSVDPGSTYYYWIRATSKAGVVGPWNAVNGVLGQTSADPAAIIDLLSEHGLYTDVPFYYQATPTTLNGVPVPVGTYVRAAYIADGTISNAKIGNLAVDNAKIANMSVGKLTAGSLAIGQYIQSSNYVSTVSGFRLNADGSVEINDLYARGNIRATSFSAITLQQGEHIKQGLTSFGDTVNNGIFFGDNGAGTPVMKLQSANGGMSWDGNILKFTTRSATSGPRLEINESVIKVYDATGLRVKIGDLAA